MAISQDEHDDYYEGFANDSLWPLYHDAVRDSTFRAGSGTPTSPSTNDSPTGSPRSPRPTRSSGCTTTTCSSCRRWCAPLRPDATHRLLPAHPVPAARAVLPGCRGGRRSSTACSVPTWSASSARSAPSNFVTIADQLHDVTVHETASETGRQAGRGYALTTPDGHVTTVGVFPISIDVGELDDLAAERHVRRGVERRAHAPRQPRGDPPRRRPPRLHEGDRPAHAGVRVVARRRPARTPTAA